MSGKSSSLLEQMREERGTYGAIFVQFVHISKYYNSFAFCFYEGEDGKYYDCRIRQKFFNRIITFSVGNKKEVLKLLKRINSEGIYDDKCMMFFVDKDYDENLLDDENLFQTPCYSIENFYVQEECLKSILQSEFGLNEIEEDFQKCLQDFRLRSKEFNEYIMEFNSLVYLRRQKSDSNSNFSFSSVKTAHLVEIGVDKISKAIKYDEVMRNIKKTLKFHDDEIIKAKIDLNTRGDFSWNFRGKNQLDFFVNFIKELKKLNKKGGYFSKRYNNIHIDITSNRLSELSQYAITPSILDDFLEKHKEQLLSSSDQR